MNSSSQTLSSQSHSFPSFQSTLPLHYSLETSKPTTIPKSHQSPLQPLQLNTNSQFPFSSITNLQKYQISSPINIASQLAASHQDLLTKSNWFPAQNSPSIQKQSKPSSQEKQEEDKSPSKMTDSRQSEQDKMKIEAPESNNPPNGGDSYDNTQSPQSDLQGDHIQEESITEAHEETQETELRGNMDMKPQIQESSNPNDVDLAQSLPESTIQGKEHESAQETEPMALEDQETIEKSQLEEIPDYSVSCDKLIELEAISNNLKEGNHVSHNYENETGRLRALSVREDKEGHELTHNGVMSQNVTNNIMSNSNEGLPLVGQDSLTEYLMKPKKARQCLNVLCFTNPNDPSLWSKQKVMNSAICKACFDAYKRNQHCFFCYQIYLDQETSASNDGKDWIECDGCKRWNHIECEMVHGIKDLNILLQGEENTYKYFCPICRNDKNAKAASKRLKSLLMTPIETLAKPPSNQKQSHTNTKAKQQQVRQNKAHANHQVENYMGEEEVINEEKIEEPLEKKFKPNPEVNLPIINNFVQKVKEKESVLSSPLDLAKKKLDSIFIKFQANKKRLPGGRPEPLHPFENHNDIDKLMNIYAGKRVQLSEQEIKHDLDLFKELSKTSTCHSEEKSNGSEFGMEVLTEATEEKSKGDRDHMEEINGIGTTSSLNIRRKLSRPKTREIHYNENSPKDDDEIMNELDALEQRKQLRSRKRFD